MDAQAARIDASLSSQCQLAPERRMVVRMQSLKRPKQLHDERLRQPGCFNGPINSHYHDKAVK
jgi:hypothetical protein